MSTAQEKLLPWDRRWLPAFRQRGAASEKGRISVSSTSVDWSTLPCVVLLGEPGSGKSTEIRRAYAAWSTPARHSSMSVLLDLREHADESRLESVWRTRVDDELSHRGAKVTVFIDSLDEGALQLRTTIDLLSRLISDTAKAWPSLLEVRIGCRTGAWPQSFERALTAAFYHETLPSEPWVVELADLDGDDVELFIRATGLPPGFSRAIDRAGAQVFANRPVTLSLLKAIFERDADLPRSRWELYERALVTLCVAPNARLSEKRLLPLPDARQQLECVATLASVVAFTGSAVIISGSETSELRHISTAGVFASERLEHLADVVIRHTPVFRPGADPGTFEFAHRTYAEFLSVWAAEWRGVPDDDVLDLVRGADGGVVPELSEIAGWLATRRPAVMNALIETEPEVLLGGDPARLDAEVQRRILSGVLRRVNEQQVPVRAGAMAGSLLRLSRPVLVEGLRDWCKNHPAREGDRAAFDVLLLIRDAALFELLGEVETVVADEGAAVDERGFACHVLGEVDRPRASAFLSRFVQPLPTGKPHPLLARALALAGRELSPSAFFAAVDRVPRHGPIGGASWQFLTSDLPSIVEDAGWQAEGLRWLGRLGPRNHDHPLSVLGFDRVVWRWGAAAEADEDVLNALVDVTVSFGRAHISLNNRGSERVGPSIPLRRRLAERLMSERIPDAGHSALAHRVLWLYSPADLSWLLDLHRTGAPSTRERVRTVLRNLADLDDRQFVDAMFVAGESDPELVEHCRWFFGPVPIEQGGEQYREEREQERKHLADVERIGDPRDRIQRALDASRKDPKVWFSLLRELSLKAGQTHYGDWANGDVTDLPGWKDASPDVRLAIVVAARRFLDEVAPPRPASWLSRSEFPSILLAGISAADLVFLDEDSDTLSLVSSAGWARWMPALLKLGGSARDWPRWNSGLKRLPGAAFRNVARSVDTILSSPAESDPGKQAVLERLARLDAFHSRTVADTLHRRIKDGGLSPAVDAAAFAALAAVRPSAATAVAMTRVAGSGPMAGACRHLLLVGHHAGWTAAMDALEARRDLAEEVVGGFASDLRFGTAAKEPAWPAGQSSKRLAELYRMLVNHFPPTPDESATSVSWIGRRENLAEVRNRLPWMLAERGDRDSVAALRVLVEWAATRTPPIDLRFSLSVAVQNLRRRAWKPKTVQQIVKMFSTRGGSKRSRPPHRPSPPSPAPPETQMTNLAPVGTAIEEVFVTGGLAPWSHVPTQEEAKLRSWISGRRPVAVVHGPTLSGKTVAVGAALEQATVPVTRLDVNREEEEAELGPILDQSLKGEGVLVVENYHMLRPKVRARLFGQLRSLVDDSAGRRRVVVVGRAVAPPDSVMDELLARVPPIVVPALRSADECRALLKRGAEAANLDFRDLDALAQLSGGSLNVAQRLGLAACSDRRIDAVSASLVRVELSSSDLVAVEAGISSRIAGQLSRLIQSVRDTAIRNGVDSLLAANLALLAFWSAREGGRCTWEAVAARAPGVGLGPFRDCLLSSQSAASWALSVAFDEAGLEVHESPFQAVAARLPWDMIGQSIGANATWEGGEFVLEGVPSVSDISLAEPTEAGDGEAADWEASAADLTSVEDILSWMGEGILENRGFPRIQILRDELGTVGRRTIDDLLKGNVLCAHPDGTPRYRFGLSALPLMRRDIADNLTSQIRPFLPALQRLWRRHHGSEFAVAGETWPPGPVDAGLLLGVAGWSGYMVVRWNEDRAKDIVLRENIMDADPKSWPHAELDGEPERDAPASDATTDEVIACWLHVSDIHVGHGDASHRADQEMVLQQLKADAGPLALTHRVPPPSILIVTGDIAFSGGVDLDGKPNSQYADAAAWITSLCSALKVDKESVLIVPGNHDVMRPVDLTPEVAAFLPGLRASGKLDAAMAKAGERLGLVRRQESFWAFAEGYKCAAPFWWKSASRGDTTVHFVGFNSALLSAGNDDEGKLRIGRRQLADLIPELSMQTVTVALVHHPLVEQTYGQDDCEAAVAELRKRRAVVLSGHVHRGESASITVGGGGALISVRAGAVHGEAQESQGHGFNFAALVRCQAGICLRVWPFQWVRAHREFRLDPSGVPSGEHFAEHLVVPARVTTNQPVSPRTAPRVTFTKGK